MAYAITIDGPSGSGKSTIAKILAKKLNITYLDTGAMYRGVGFFVTEKGIKPGDADKVNAVLDEIDMDIRYENGEQKVYINEKDVTPYIREHHISMAASTVSKIPEVRLKLVELQRKIAAKTNCVMDGRDIGSYVLPDAKYKFFLTASSEVRAERRYKELIEKGQNVSFEDVLDDINKRDLQDSTRAFAPLVIPEGAVVIDSGSMTIAEVEEKIVSRLWK